MNKPIQLAAIDIDGTLLRDDYTLSLKTAQVLRTVHKIGVEIVLCTGRSPGSSFPILEEIGINGYLIAHNGAVTTHSEKREALREAGFSIDEMRQVVEYCRSRSIHFDASSAFGMYTEDLSDPAMLRLYESYFASPVQMKNIFDLKEKVVKFTLTASDHEITGAVHDLEAMRLPFKVIRSGEQFIDIIHPDASKGEALKHLARELRVDLKQAIAFGNYYNDLEMIKEVGLGMAVANAPKDVQLAAKAVVPSNNEDGVAFALERYVLQPYTANHR